MMMDVEKVLAETARTDDEVIFRSVVPIDAPGCHRVFADDSIVARKQIQRTLEAMGVKYVSVGQWPAGVAGTGKWRTMPIVSASLLPN